MLLLLRFCFNVVVFSAIFALCFWMARLRNLESEWRCGVVLMLTQLAVWAIFLMREEVRVCPSV